VHTASKSGLDFGGGATEGTGRCVHSYFNNNSNELKQEERKKDEDEEKSVCKKTRNKNVWNLGKI
jgi:hypothetical protein